MQSIEISILKTAAYFDVFQYPLTKQEISYFMDQQCDEYSLDITLGYLIDNEVLFKLGDFYSLSNDMQLLERRLKGNNAAFKELKKAKRTSAFLYRWFPFITGIGISGSLSKNVAHKHSDFDFFIITAENRLWISRTIFILFYHVACLFGLKKRFCLNYLIDEEALEIEEKNIFTATEVSTLLICDGRDVCQRFFDQNKWVENLMPNYKPRIFETNLTKQNLFRKSVEKLFNNQLGSFLNKKILQFYERRWKKLSAKNKFTLKGFKLGGMIITPHICKPMPQHFQQTILNKFNERFEKAKNLMSDKLDLKLVR